MNANDLSAALEAAGLVGHRFELASKLQAGGFRCSTFTDAKPAATWLAALPPGDRYLGLAPLRRDAVPPSGRARDEDALTVSVLLVDVDPDDASDANRNVAGEIAAAILARFQATGARAAVVSSGRGVQFWLWHESTDPSDPRLRARERLLRALALRFDREGAHVDVGVFNVARLARLPGTVNMKTGEVAEILAGVDQGRTLTLDEIEELAHELENEASARALPVPAPVPRTPRPAPVPAKFKNGAARANGTGSIFAGIREAEDKSVESALRGVPEGGGPWGGRDAMVTSLAATLRHEGRPRAEAETLVLEAARNCSPPFDELDALAKVASAWENLEGPPEPDPAPAPEEARALLWTTSHTGAEVQSDFQRSARTLLRGRRSFAFAFERAPLTRAASEDPARTLCDRVNETVRLVASLETATAAGVFALFREPVEQIEADGVAGVSVDGLWRVVSSAWARERARLAQALATGAPPLPATEEPEARLTDLGNARRLVRLHGSDLRYCERLGGWFIWDERRWAKDETGEAERRAQDVPAALCREAEDYLAQARAVSGNESTVLANKAQALIAHALKTEAAGRLSSLLQLARVERGLAVAPLVFDRDPWLLNVLNGTLDLRTGELRPHERGDLLTKLVPAPWDPHAECPTWRAFVSKILGGKPDIVAFVQRAVGYSLTGATTEQVLFFLYGTGSNGKSTFLETIRALIADYAHQANFDTFLTKQGAQGPRNDVARLKGARLVTALEAPEGTRFDETLIKTLTGGDTVAARFLYREDFEFVPTFKLWLAANHRPAIRGTDHAIWRRIRLVPFMVKFHDGGDPALRKDPALREKLMVELPGILRWAVEGALAWQRTGLGAPQEVTAATSEYRAEQDTLGQFLEETCVLDASARAQSSFLYAAYSSWAERRGERPFTHKTFSARLVERGFAKQNDEKNVVQFHGLSLRRTPAARGRSPFSENGAIFQPSGPSGA